MSVAVNANPDQSSELLWTRYREAVAKAPEWNDTLSILLSHRSVRSYLPDPLPAGTLETLIAAAQSAASSSNLQLWSVIAVEDQGRKDRLAEYAHHQKHIGQTPLFLIWLADLFRIGKIAEAQNVPNEGMNYIESLVVAVVDAALAAQNAVVAAESLGLGTVYIGAIRNQPEKVAAELKLPPHILPVFGLCVGYPDPTAPSAVKPRLPQSVILHREAYSWDSQAEGIAGYDARVRSFYEEQGIKSPSWTETILNRVKSPESLNGRQLLRVALNKLGFELR